MANQKRQLLSSSKFFDEMQEKMEAEDIKRRKLSNKSVCSQPEMLFLQFKPNTESVKDKEDVCYFSSKCLSQPGTSSSAKKSWRPPMQVVKSGSSNRLNWAEKLTSSCFAQPDPFEFNKPQVKSQKYSPPAADDIRQPKQNIEQKSEMTSSLLLSQTPAGNSTNTQPVIDDESKNYDDDGVGEKITSQKSQIVTEKGETQFEKKASYTTSGMTVLEITSKIDCLKSINTTEISQDTLVCPLKGDKVLSPDETAIIDLTGVGNQHSRMDDDEQFNSNESKVLHNNAEAPADENEGMMIQVSSKLMHIKDLEANGNEEQEKCECSEHDDIINSIDLILSEGQNNFSGDDETEHNIKHNVTDDQETDGKDSKFLIDSIFDNSSSDGEYENPQTQLQSKSLEIGSVTKITETKLESSMPEENKESMFFPSSDGLQRSEKTTTISTCNGEYHDLTKESDKVKDIPSAKTTSVENKFNSGYRDVLDDEYSCMMISDSQLLEIEKRYYETPQTNGMTSARSEMRSKVVSTGTQTEVPAAVIRHVPSVQWPKKMEDSQRKLREAIQEIERLNTILLRIREEIWPQRHQVNDNSSSYGRDGTRR